jgi:murein DD-endopeptidase MepM/ murein hydrolase activator NlpD
MNKKKLLNIALSILLLFNSFAPYAFAQEQIPSLDQEVATPSAMEELINSLLATDSAMLDASPAGKLDLKTDLSNSLQPVSTNPSASIMGKVIVSHLPRNNYQYKEKISLNVYNVLSGDFTVRVLDSKGRAAKVEILENDLTDKIQININPSKSFAPGKYIVEISKDGEVVSTQDFTWGVLAINTNKSIYLPEETAGIAIAVLSETGELVCNANVALTISDPNGAQTVLSTDNGKIKVNSICTKKEFTLVPDYETSYQIGEVVGNYSIELEATTGNGTYTITDGFQVQGDQPFQVERIAPTRLYPPLIYPVGIRVTANEDFTGKVTEVVPSDFELFDSTDSTALKPNSIVTVPTSTVNQKRVLGLRDLSMPFSGTHSATLGFGEDLSLIDPNEKGLYQQYGLQGHDGIDFEMDIGTPILSIDDGTIVRVDEKGDYGWTAVIKHQWGQSYYGHLSKFSVTVGQEILKGGEVGLSGNSGHVTGPHLHFGIKLNVRDVNNGYYGKTDPAPLLGLPTDGRVLGVSASDQDSQSKVLTWDISVKKGDIVTLSYRFKAPGTSPEFYTIGPARFFNENQDAIFQEIRPWQLAVDAGNYSGRQVKTVEYILGGGTETSSQATTITSYTGSSWNTTKGSAGTTSVILAGSNIEVRNAYLEMRTIRQTAANITDVDMFFDANPGPNAGSDTRVSPVLQSGANYQGSTGLSQWLMVRSDVTSQLETQTDSDWTTGVAVVAGISATGPSRAATTMKLVITYELDYSPTSHTELKTVRFPLTSVTSGDTGTKRAACAAAATCSFTFNAQIPDLLSGSNSNIKSVFMEIHGNTDSATVPSITPQINGGSAGTSVSEQEAIADERDMYILYAPSVGGADFVPNAAKQLDIINGSVAINTLGGEVVVTYLYDVTAATQTDTVRYWVQQQAAETGTTKTAFPDGASNITISNASRSIKNLWFRVHTAHAAAQTFTVFGKVGAATEKSQAYTLTGTNARAGETTLIYNMSADAASFSSATTKVTGASQFSSATGDTEVGAELFVTFTWVSSGTGDQTKTILYNVGTSPINSVVANEYHNFPFTAYLPEAVTKTHRSTYIDTTKMHSQSATTISVGTVTTLLNGGSILSLSEQDDTEAFSRTYVASISASLFTGDSSPQSANITFSRRSFEDSASISVANIYDVSDVFVLTYDAAFSETGTTESVETIRTVEYALGGGSDGGSRISAAIVYTGSSWNATKGSAGTISVVIPGTGIQVRNAYLEARIVAATSTTLTDVDMTIDANPGPNAGTDGRVSPVIQGTYYATSGLSYWVMARANVTSQLSIQSDSDWNSGVAVVTSLSVTGPTTQLNSMKLVVTYEQDYSDTPHNELKTVRFPLSSTISGDTGTKRTACAGAATCSFTYSAQIPDLINGDTANIESVFFEIHATTDSATAPTFTPQINGGSAGTSIGEGDTIADMRDLFAIYVPPIGGSDFRSNISQQLDIINGAAVLNVLGGELVVTYQYSTGSPLQTETVRYFAQQQAAETGLTKTAFSNSSYTISNIGLSVRNIWYKVTTAQSAAQTFTVYGQVGTALEKSQAYALTGTNSRGGESVIFYDMSADVRSFSSPTTTVTGASQFSSATGDTEVGAEIYITFTWSGVKRGTQTRTVVYNAGTSGGEAYAANEYYNATTTVFLPESVTKTYRSAYILDNIGHTNGTTITLSTINLDLNGTNDLSIGEQDDTEAFSRTYLIPITSTKFSGGTAIGFQKRAFELSQSINQANRAVFSNTIVVTYDAAFAAGPVETPTLSQIMKHGDWFDSAGTEQPFTF